MRECAGDNSWELEQRLSDTASNCCFILDFIPLSFYNKCFYYFLSLVYFSAPCYGTTYVLNPTRQKTNLKCTSTLLNIITIFPNNSIALPVQTLRHFVYYIFTSFLAHRDHSNHPTMYECNNPSSPATIDRYFFSSIALGPCLVEAVVTSASDWQLHGAMNTFLSLNPYKHSFSVKGLVLS